MKLSDYLKSCGVIQGFYNLIQQGEVEDAMTVAQTVMTYATDECGEETFEKCILRDIEKNGF